MSDISIVINGTPYSIACDPGEEKQVQQLGRYVDGRVREIARMVGQQSDNHLLVLLSLFMANDLSDMQKQIDALNKQLQEMPEPQVEIRTVVEKVIERVEVPVEVQVPMQMPDNMPQAANDAQLAEMGEMVHNLSQKVASLASRIKALG